MCQQESLIKQANENSRKIVELTEENEKLSKTIESLSLYNTQLITQASLEIRKKDLKLKKKDASVQKLTQNVHKLEKTIDHLIEENAELKTMWGASVKEIESLTREYEEARKKIYIMRNYDKEKICNRCKKVFTDENNFNWSCKTHVSQYSGSLWWCCGKSDKEAEGCRMSYHESINDKQEKKKYNRLFCTVSYMQSCKTRGHINKNCFKDPNLMTTNEVGNEIERIENLIKVKLEKKKSVNDLNESIRKSQFMTSIIEAESSFNMSAAELKVVFGDIDSLKQNSIIAERNTGNKTGGPVKPFFSGSIIDFSSDGVKNPGNNLSVVFDKGSRSYSGISFNIS